MNDLNTSLNGKQYTQSSLALDSGVYVKATVTICNINIYYYIQNEFRKHKFEPYPVTFIDVVR